MLKDTHELNQELTPTPALSPEEPKKKHAGGRPRKQVDPSLQSIDSTAPTAPATPAHQPGSAEAIAEIAASLLALNPGDFKTGQMYTTASENLRAVLAHHKGIQAAETAARDKARLDQVPALETTIKTLTGEIETAKVTTKALKDEIDRLKPRAAKGDLWDAQVSRQAADAKAEQERIATEETEAKEQNWRKEFLAKYQARVDQDVKNAQAEENDEEAHRRDVRGQYQQFGQPGCGLYNDHQAELVKRATNLRYLSYAQRLMNEKEFTRDQAKALEKNFLDAASTKARQDEHAELTRQHLDPTPDFDPSFDYVPPTSNPNQSDRAPTRGNKPYDYGHSLGCSGCKYCDPTRFR